MVLAVKRRCRNAVDRRSRRRNFDRRCESTFIPLVTVDDDEDSDNEDHPPRGRRQLLTCRYNIPGFLTSCPSAAAEAGGGGGGGHLPPACNPVRENARRCETTHAALSAGAGRCRLFEVVKNNSAVANSRARWNCAV